MTAKRVFWVTEEQRARGLRICRRYLSASMTRKIQKRHQIIGGGITELVKPYALPDKTVKKNLQKKKGKDFMLSFVGRFTANKNPQFILDTMRPLFAKESIKLQVVSVGDPVVPDRGYNRVDSKDARVLIGHHESGGKKGRDYYAGKILPSLQCGISATITEAHPSIPREGIYVGVPWVLPDRPWARAMFKDEYPFYYKDEAEFVAMVKKIRDGRVTDAECKRFNACRHNRDMIEFMEDTARKMQDCVEEDTYQANYFFRNQNYDQLEDCFDGFVSVGDEFVWQEAVKYCSKNGGKGGAAISHRPRVRSPFDFYSRMRRRIEVINPKTGLFRRIE